MDMDAQGNTTLSEDEELHVELMVLRAVSAVTSANAYPSGRVDLKVNNNFIKVAAVDLEKPLTVHCSKLLPTKLHAVGWRHENVNHLSESKGSERFQAVSYERFKVPRERK